MSDVEAVLSGAEPWAVVNGDCLAVLPTLPPACADSCVCDPPYALGEPRSGGDGVGKAFAPRTAEAKAKRRGGFMGKAWDNDVAFRPETWAAVLRVLKPGAYLLAFGGTRTYHRLTCAIEDAGFEVRDCLMWVYGTGFPKGKGCLKPAWEPIVLARKPGGKVRPLQIDECRTPLVGEDPQYRVTPSNGKVGSGGKYGQYSGEYAGAEQPTPGSARHDARGRWPANVLHDGSDEVLEAFATFGEKASGKQCEGGHVRNSDKHRNAYAPFAGQHCEGDVLYGDSGSAARFFFCSKATRADRGAGNRHPTVKPVALMQWLARLVTPSDGVCLDPFSGSGTTGVAARLCGRRFIGVELQPEYADLARKRIAAACPLDDACLRAAVAAQPTLFDEPQENPQ